VETVKPAPRLGSGKDDEFGRPGAGFREDLFVSAADADADSYGFFGAK
jgi:hypothetical protein